MAFSINIIGSGQVQRALSKLILGSDKMLRDAIYPTVKDWAGEFRAAYRQKGIKFVHRAMKITTRKRDLKIVVIGGQMFEWGTGKYRNEPYAAGSRRSRARGRAPYLVEASRKAGRPKVLLGRRQDRRAAAKDWKGRPVFGRRAMISGMKPRPVIAQVLPGMVARLPGDVGPEVVKRLREAVTF